MQQGLYENIQKGFTDKIVNDMQMAPTQTGVRIVSVTITQDLLHLVLPFKFLEDFTLPETHTTSNFLHHILGVI